MASLHQTFLKIAEDSGLSILSMGSDGAAVEVSAQDKLNSQASSFILFDCEEVDLHLKIPLYGKNSKPLITVQDPKHARKTAANQILSGARLLSFGKFYISIGHLALIIQHPKSTLFQRDVFNSDRQDDGRAYRTLNHETCGLAMSLEPCMGLTIYLFVMGELCDAWLNSTSSPSDRILSAFTSHFFLVRWQEYLDERQEDSPGLMCSERNGVSHQSIKTFLSLSISLLSLIIAHREHYPAFPFMPWKHGTEACEHIFGWMRHIMPDFTVLDARQMMPKLLTIIKNIMEKNISIPVPESNQSGYQYSRQEGKDSSEFNQDFFTYPTDDDIRYLLIIAKTRANTLLQFVGMQNIDGQKINKTSQSLNESLELFSISSHQSLDLTGSQDELDQTDAITASANVIGRRHHLDSELNHLNLTDDDIDHDYISASRISINNLLNPTPERKSCVLNK